MTRAFHSLDDGSLVEVEEHNKKKYQPDKFETEEKKPIKKGSIILYVILFFVIFFGGFFIFMVALIFTIFKRMMIK